MKISFMTLGCPTWDLETICRNGQAYGFDGVDFRGYLDNIDITTLPMFTSGAAETKRKLADAGSGCERGQLQYYRVQSGSAGEEPGRSPAGPSRWPRDWAQRWCASLAAAT